MMALKRLFFISLLLVTLPSLVAKDVPRMVTYCGMTLELSPDARAKIQEYVDNIMESPRYFNEMVKRAHTYMPFIEEAFNEAGIPDDLKYLAIQESALRPDVVSASQAVGFWQFKEGTARDFGLTIDSKVDERMHIFRSSQAAAKFMAQANRDYQNWVYALLAYFHGFTGSVQYTDPQYYGSSSMVITMDLHWYPMKAIAHKLAYEDAVSLRQRPLVTLVPYSTDGETMIRRILETHQGTDEESFFLYNKWIRDRKRLPRESLYTYYIPKPAEFYTGHIEDPVKIQLAGGPRNPAEVVGSMSGFGERPKPYQVPDLDRPTSSGPSPERTAVPVGNMAGSFRALEPDNLPRDQYVIFNMIYDLDYGQQFILYNGWIGMPELSERLGIRLGQLLNWNNLTPTEKPQEGKILYLRKPSSSEYHIVSPGESIESIAMMRRKSAGSIIRKNRLDRSSPVIFVGQKLYLKKKRPKNEKIIILKYEKEKEQSGGTPVTQQPTPRPGSTPVRPSGSSNQPQPTRVVEPAPNPQVETPNPISDEERSQWIIHTVRPGETLWQISQKYGTQVAILKRINELESNNIQIGQELKVLQRNED